MKNPPLEQADIAILGSGPAGMQTALVTSRTRKKVVVFDAPQPPRNAASHGVHNFLGLDGLKPEEIRKIAWQQIQVYDSAHLRKERVVDVQKNSEGRFIITGDQGTALETAKVVLAVGFHDVYPEIPGFVDCWANTIIPCPFCDGYENRDRLWGIIGPATIIKHFTKMVQNWTNRFIVFTSEAPDLTPQDQEDLVSLGVPIHDGKIKEIHHTEGKVESVTLASGEKVNVETLLWSPPQKPSSLVQNMIDNLGMELDDSGYVKTDDMQKTNIEGLWAAGDVQGAMGALESAYAGGLAAAGIVHEWFH